MTEIFDHNYLRRRGLMTDSPIGEIFVEKHSRRNPNTTVWRLETPFDSESSATKTSKKKSPKAALKSAKKEVAFMQFRGINPEPDTLRFRYLANRKTQHPTYQERQATKAHNRQVHENRTRTMGRGGGGWTVQPTGLLGKATDKWFKKG